MISDGLKIHIDGFNRETLTRYSVVESVIHRYFLEWHKATVHSEKVAENYVARIKESFPGSVLTLEQKGLAAIALLDGESGRTEYDTLEACNLAFSHAMAEQLPLF